MKSHGSIFHILIGKKNAELYLSQGQFESHVGIFFT